MASPRTSSSRLSSVADGVKSAARYTAGAVPGLLTGTAAVAGAAGSALVGAASYSGHACKSYAGAAAKGVAGATAGAATGAMAASTAGALTLKAVGFHTVGPAAGSYAAAWMSSNAIANGGGVAANSLFSAVQAASMSGSFFLGSPAVLAVGAVAGAAVWRARL